MDTNPNTPQNPGPQHPAPQNAGPQDGLTRPIESAARPSGAHARPELGQQPPVPPAQVPPGGPSGPVGPGGPGKPPKAKRSTGKLIGLIAAGVVALVVIAFVGIELYVRNHIEGCLADNIKSGAKANDVSVSFAKTPMLIQNASGKMSSIDITIDGLQGTSGLNVRILLKGVDPSGDNRIDDATILGEFTADGIKNKVAQVPLLSDPKVTLNPSANRIEITTGLITINLTPSIKDNKVVLTASKASILGFGVPDELAQQAITAIADIPTPNGLTASDLKMTDQAVSLRYSGQNVLPKDIESGNDVGATNCSVL
ncbi:LmeA family phospholipid-binding protein [Tsukamurella sp. NPDC003166]|uniref:LmeA family phospholipid-binding protein n=1 Tax=Tsukamurella sp. NPDC003166 TaxID=3154444 RepID=UPI0033B518FF